MGTLPGIVNGSAEIEPGDIQLMGPLLDPKYTDDAAVQLTIQDARRARAWLDQKQWNLYWRESDVLFQSPRTSQPFEGSTVARANISRFRVATTVNSLVPAMKGGIFYENPPFLIRPRPATSQKTARAKTALYGAQLDKAKFEDVSERALEYMTNFGTVIVKAGWEKVTKTKKVRAPKAAPVRIKIPLGGEIVAHTKESDEVVVTPQEFTEQKLTVEMCELGSVLVDPTWNVANSLHDSAKYVIHVTYPTFKDLDALREQKIFDEDGNQVGGYDIPSEQELKDYFFAHQDNAAGQMSMVAENLGGQNYSVHHAQSEDVPASESPVERPIQCLERTDDTYVYAVLCPDGSDRGVLIRKEEHGFPFINFFSANFWNIPNAGFGIGCGRLSGSTQRIEKGLIDAMLDILSFACNPMYARDRGANAPTQQIRSRLGGIVDVDTRGNQSVRDVFGIIEPPQVPKDVFAILQESVQNDQSTTGADEAFTQGSLPGRGGSSAARTATGAGGIISANAGRIQGPVGHFVKGILIPVIQLLEWFVKNKLSPKEIRETLDNELGDAFDLDMQNFYQSEDRFECLAGARLAAKKAMAQALPMLMQVLENPQIIQAMTAMGYTVDVRELLAMYMEVTEWRNSRELIRPMTPQERQNFMQASQAQAKGQQQIAAIGARHQAKSAEIDQQNEAKLAQSLVGKASDEAALWDERRWDRETINQSVFAPG